MTSDNTENQSEGKEILPADKTSDKPIVPKLSETLEDNSAEVLSDIQSMPREMRQQVQSFMGMIRSQTNPSAKNPLIEKFSEAI